MGESRTEFFIPKGQTRFIYTEGLNGCSAVVIVSTFACIMAHIPPLPEFTHDPNIGDENVRLMMDDISLAFQANRPSFPASHSWVVIATWRGQVALSDQAAILEDTIDQRLGIPRTTVSYYVLDPEEPRHELKGTLIVAAMPQKMPRVWIEGQLQDPEAETESKSQCESELESQGA
jgi:hypothetical protein